MTKRSEIHSRTVNFAVLMSCKRCIAYDSVYISLNSQEYENIPLFGINDNCDECTAEIKKLELHYQEKYDCWQKIKDIP